MSNQYDNAMSNRYDDTMSNRYDDTMSNRYDDTMSNRYDDIIDLPHHVSKTHKPMPMEARAAQFAPFAALINDKDDETSLFQRKRGKQMN